MTSTRCIEDQIAIYADAIDPALSSPRTTPALGGAGAENPEDGQGSLRRWHFGPALLVAAALILVFAAFVTLRADDRQAVESDFVQRPDDVPATGDLWTREQQLVIHLAESALLAECMADQGYVWTAATDAEAVAHFGSWRPHGILGIGATSAASTLGYRSAGWGGNDSPTMSAGSQPEGYAEALLGGPDTPMIPTQTLDGSPAPGGRQMGGCWASVESQLGDYVNRTATFTHALQLGSDGTQGERFRTDPQLAAAIEAWQICVRDATGILADTPNALARQFVFGDNQLTDFERDVAVSDATCQRETALEQTFSIARTAQFRAELGSDAVIFDDYVRLRIETQRLAQQVLDERGIEAPSLDA